MKFNFNIPTELSEREARRIVKDWFEEWLDKAVGDTRPGVNEVSNAVRNLRSTLASFERANSGDNCK